MGNQVSRTKIVRFSPTSRKFKDYDDVQCLLNITQVVDLEQILKLTPARRRLNVALAFTDFNFKFVFESAGVVDYNSDATYISRLVNRKVRLPMGVAFRIAKVFGIPAELLFEYWT